MPPKGGAIMRPYGFRGNGETGFQRHHLIPVNIIDQPVFKGLFDGAQRVGFDPHNFLCNGCLLPGTENLVIRTGLPLHRGPHPHYDALVSECLSVIWGNLVAHKMLSDIGLFQRVSTLQDTLRRALRSDASLMLNRNDPRFTSDPLRKLDYDIFQLGTADLLA